MCVHLYVRLVVAVGVGRKRYRTCVWVFADVYYAWTPVMCTKKIEYTIYTYIYTYMWIGTYLLTLSGLLCRATLCETSVETNVINCIIEEHYILISHQAVNFIWPSLCVVGMHRAKSNGVYTMQRWGVRSLRRSEVYIKCVGDMICCIYVRGWRGLWSSVV